MKTILEEMSTLAHKALKQNKDNYNEGQLDLIALNITVLLNKVKSEQGMQ